MLILIIIIINCLMLFEFKFSKTGIIYKEDLNYLL